MKKIMMILSLLLTFAVALAGCGEEKVTTKPAEEKNVKIEKKEMPVEEKEDESIANSQEYLRDMTNVLEDFTVILNDFAELSTQAGQNPYVMTTNDWIMDTAIVLTEFDTAIQEARAIEEPENPELLRSHRLIMQAMDEYQFIVDNYPDAIDNLDTDLLNECILAMSRARGYFEEAITINIDVQETL
ncbi:hypothetical protein [Pseudobutyrivibrio sp.]